MLLYLFYGQTSWQKSMKTNISCIMRRKLLLGVPLATSSISLSLSPSLFLSLFLSLFFSVSLWSPTSPQETRSSSRVTFVMSIFCDRHQSRIAIAVAVVVAAFVVVVAICWLPRCVLTSDCVRVLSFSGHTQRGPPRTVDRVLEVDRGQQAAPWLSVEN